MNWNYNFGYNQPPMMYPYGYGERQDNTNVSYQPQQNLICGRVRGKNGAINSQLNPNMTGIFLDETAPILWIKTSDPAGRAVLNGYNLSPISEETTVDEVQSTYGNKLDLLIDRIDAIERRIDGLNVSKSGAPAIKQKQRPIAGAQPGASKGNLSDDKEF